MQTEDAGADVSSAESNGGADTDTASMPDTDLADTGTEGGDTGEPDTPVPQGTYADLANWLCHPDRDDDPCDEDLSLTRVFADGTTEVVTHQPAAAPEVDCFYVYPTTSLDSTANSDLNAGIEEAFVVRNQAARLDQHCRFFAPIYRQVTLVGLFNPEADFDLAYGDVADAFQNYLDVHNNGRGFI
ncbi:MAG: DUF3089 domain-containing protein, partial [Myxococcota bacterium]